MSEVFHARVATVEIHDSFALVGFADDPATPGNYLIIQRAHRHDEHDRALGMDCLYLELCDQGRSLYGGLVSVTASKDTLELELNQRGQAALGVTGKLIIRLDPNVADADSAIEKFRELAEADGIRFRRI